MTRAKEAAGRRAAEFVEDGMRVGLGTGSTVHYVLLRLAERIRDERLSIRGVPTSLDTERKARELGIPLIDLAEAPALDLTLDGADEIDGAFRMIKGGGGALLREKVVASASRRVAIVVDASKVVERLGKAFPLPVEVVPFAHASVHRRLEQLGARPELRSARGDEPYRTDNGNEILDCRFANGIPDPAALEKQLARIPGVVESGLFIGLAHRLVIGHEDGRVDVRSAPADGADAEDEGPFAAFRRSVTELDETWRLWRALRDGASLPAGADDGPGSGGAARERILASLLRSVRADLERLCGPKVTAGRLNVTLERLLDDTAFATSADRRAAKADMVAAYRHARGSALASGPKDGLLDEGALDALDRVIEGVVHFRELVESARRR